MLQQYKEAIEKSNIISKTDTDGIITFVNDEFCKISGYTKDELLGQNHNIVRDPDALASEFKTLWDTINAKKIYKSTVKNCKKNSQAFYVNTTIIPILDEKQNIVEFIAIRYDVTNEMLYKEELEKKDKELHELNITLEKRVQEKTSELKELNATLELRVQDEVAKNEAKQKVMFSQARLASLGEMLANIAHQWRQPLTELSLTLFSIKKAAINKNEEELQEFYGESKDIIQNMSNSIDNFTNFFKPDKVKQNFKVADSINESLDILQRVISKEIVVVKTNFEDVEIFGVVNEFNQVVINLIKNSIDAFVCNSILLREIHITVIKNQHAVVIEFQDNAGGIKEKEIDKIYEPYFTTKHKSQGTGLGLFMSKMICEKGFNASLDVKSKRNTTTFSIEIPLEENYA